MSIKNKTEQKNALNSSIVPENKALLTPVSLTQTETEQPEAIKNTLVSKGHKQYIEDFDNLKKVEAVNIRFLKLLNYDPTGTIYARVIGGKSPENKSGEIMSLMKTLKDCNEKKNQNVYFVVNGGGHKAEDVQVGRALMLEIDKDEQGNLIPIDDQYQIMVDKFGIPTIAVFTGNKSIHCYYAYEEPIDPQLWQEMQLDALAYCPIADQSIKDLPRILRLVGFKHSKTGRYSEVYAQSGIKYSYDELRSKIPVRTFETKKKKPVVKARKAGNAVKLPQIRISKEALEKAKTLDINYDRDEQGIITSYNLTSIEWAKMPYPPLDEYENLISVKTEYEELPLTLSLEDLKYEEIHEFLTIKTALEVLPEEYAIDYEMWRQVLCAVKSASARYPNLESHLYELADIWSQTADNYDPQGFLDKWDNTVAEGGIQVGSLIKWAKDVVGNKSNDLTFQNLFDFKYPWSRKNKEAVHRVASEVQDESKPRWKDPRKNDNTRIRYFFDDEIVDKGAVYNVFTQKIELGDRAFSSEELFFYISEQMNMDVFDSIIRKCIDIFLSDSSKHYHPFVDYIKSLSPDNGQKQTEERIKWAKSVVKEQLMQEVLSINEDNELFSLYELQITTWLSGLIERTLNPGCKFDHVLVLNGSQSLGKTTFFESLVGVDFFRSHAGSVTDKDSIMAFMQNVLIELGEISSTFRKSDQEVMKNFITTRVDQIRLPYSARIQTFPRKFVLCASTNDEQFLLDPTGNRRYFVIPVYHVIDNVRLLEIRDDLLTAIQVLMQAGLARSYLNRTEIELLNQANRKYTSLYKGELLEEILTTTHSGFNPDQFTLMELLKTIEEYYPKNASTGLNEAKIGASLRAMGFEKKRVRANGKQKTVWARTLPDKKESVVAPADIADTVVTSNTPINNTAKNENSSCEKYLTMQKDIVEYHENHTSSMLLASHYKHMDISKPSAQESIKKQWLKIKNAN